MISSCREDHLSQRAVLFCAFFFPPKGKSPYITTKAFISVWLGRCWHSLITLCGAAKNHPKKDFWKRQKTPPGNIFCLLAASPKFPPRNCLKAGRGMDGLGLPPSLRSVLLEARPELMTISSLQSPCYLREARSPGPPELPSQRGISHSCSRETEDSDQQLRRGCREGQHKQLLNFHYKRFSSTLGILCIIEIAFYPKRSTLKSGP